MNNYELIVESTCSLNRELRAKYSLYYKSLDCLISINNDEFDCDLEWKNFTEEKYYSLIKKNANKVKTSFASFSSFESLVKPILDEGKDIIIFCLSTGISGTYNAYIQFKNIILENYKDRKITIIDTLRYSGGSGLLAINAGINKQKGVSYEDNVNWCLTYRNNIHECGVMDDLSFLARNGRISAPKAFFGQLAGVVPFADFTSDGKTEPLGTIKGKKNSLNISINYFLKTAKDIEHNIVIIAHSNRIEKALEFKKVLLEKCNPKEVILIPVDQSCGANLGPGLCSYFYFGDEIQKGREKEILIFNSLLSK